MLSFIYKIGSLRSQMNTLECSADVIWGLRIFSNSAVDLDIIMCDLLTEVVQRPQNMIPMMLLQVIIAMGPDGMV